MFRFGTTHTSFLVALGASFGTDDPEAWRGARVAPAVAVVPAPAAGPVRQEDGDQQGDQKGDQGGGAGDGEGAQGGQVLDAVTDAPTVATATPEQLDVMLRLYEDALEEGRAADVIEALRRMEWHDNPELAEPAIRALDYEASKADEEAVEEEASLLGITKRSELRDLVLELESEVQAVAARVLATIPGRDAERALVKAMKRKDVQKERPLTLASVIAALGTRGSDAAAKVAEDELKQGRHPLLARAAVRYFGQVKTKDLDVVRILIGMLDPPEPVDVHSASNPPASYWAARWETWSHTRRDVVWTLHEVTGRTWNPAEGDQPSDSARALEYVEENAKRLGLR